MNRNLLRFALVFFFVMTDSGLRAQTASVPTNTPFDLGLHNTAILRIAVQRTLPVLIALPSANVLPGGTIRYVDHGLITSVNGEAAQGYWSSKVIAPDTRKATGIYLTSWTFDIAEADGTPAGVITAIGIPDGPGLPAPEDLMIVSGSNAYFGVHGAIARSTIPGGSARAQAAGNGYELNFVATFTPLCRSTVTMLNGVPAIAHGKDFTTVTSNSPAVPGEILSLVATDLLPELKDSTSWPADPEPLFNIPVVVRAGGLITKILYVGKYPGARSAYQINFQLPPEVQAGIVDVQISTGYIDGQVVSIPIR